MPISAGGWNITAPTYQMLGGTWNSATDQFTVSPVVTGTLGSPTSIDTSVNQRALWTDANGNMLGASFLATASPATVIPVVTPLYGQRDAPGLASKQFVLGDWSTSAAGPAASPANPVYLSLSANNPVFDNYTLWYDGSGTGWSQITPSAAPRARSPGTFRSTARFTTSPSPAAAATDWT